MKLFLGRCPPSVPSEVVRMIQSVEESKTSALGVIGM